MHSENLVYKAIGCKLGDWNPVRQEANPTFVRVTSCDPVTTLAYFHVQFCDFFKCI